MLPQRKPKVRSGIERAPRREWPKHRQWLRGFQCVVPGCDNRQIECCHVRITDGPDTGAGIGQKPHDAFTVPMCSQHHDQSHNVGTATFERMYRVNLLALAREFASRSPDIAMKEAMKEGGAL